MRTALLIILFAATSGCMRDAPKEASILAGVGEANAAYDRALIAGDAAALGNIYAEDFTIIDDDGAIHGKQDQIAFMTTKVDLLDARSDDIKVTPLGPDAALVTGRFTGSYRMDGKENAFTERYTSVWVRKDGAWKVRHEHASLLPNRGQQPAD